MAHFPKATAFLAVLILAAPVQASPDDADDRYRFLVGLVEKGLHELAIDEATGFLSEYPRHTKANLARYRLATAFFALDRLADAEPHYRELTKVQRFEYRAECLFRAGQCALVGERIADAQRFFEAVLEEQQEYLHPAALYLLGECGQRSADLGEARRRFEQLLERAPDGEQAQAARRAIVWVAWEEGNHEETVLLADRYLKRHGAEAEAEDVRVLKGEALLELGRPEQALEVYRSVGEGAAYEAALRGTGYALAERGAHAEAAAAFDRLVERFPEGRFHAEAQLQRGVQRMMAGDSKGAAKALSAADAEDPEVLLWLARAQEQDGQLEAALASLQSAAGRQPEAELASRISVARGAVLQKLGRTDQALAAFESADSEYALAAAAIAGLNEGDVSNAARLAQRLIDRHPESEYLPQATFVLAEADFAAGNYGSARERFASVAAKPQDTSQAARALSRIGWCDYLAGEPEAAARAFVRVEREYPSAPEAAEASYMAARSFDDAGDRGQAVAAWRNYLEKHPRGERRAEALYALGRLLDGDESKALFAELATEFRSDELAPRALFELAEHAAQEGDQDGAIQAYEELLTLTADGGLAQRARYGLAWILHEKGLSKRAAGLLERIVSDREADGTLVKAAQELGVWAHAAAGDPASAEAAWRAYLQDSDDDRERFRATRRLAEAWNVAGEPKRARAAFETLLKDLSDPAVAVDVLVEGAYAALDEGDLDRAEAQVRVADRQGVSADHVGEAAFFVAEARYEQGDQERAATLYERAASSQSEFADDALYKLGFVRMRADRLDGAVEAFGSLVERYPESELFGESLFLLGETHYRRGRYDEALQALGRLRQEAPRHQVIPKALFRYGLSAGRLERWSEAEKALATLAKEHEDFPNLTEAELWRGRALAAQGKTRPARQAFERVVTLDRGALAAEARLEIGELLRAEGRTEDALAEFLKVAVLYEHPEHVPAALLAAGACLEQLDDPARARERYAEILAEYASSAAAPLATAAIRRLESQ